MHPSDVLLKKNSYSPAFIDHLKELRKRLIYMIISVVICACAGFFLFDWAIIWLSNPFDQINLNTSEVLYITSLFEGFVTKIKFSIMLGVILSIPVMIYHSLRFILPGLKSVEKKLIFFSLLTSSILAFFSFYLTYFKLIPLSIQFLTSSAFIPQNVGLLFHYEKNLFYVFNLLVYSIIIFQFPILLEVCLYLNIISRKFLLNGSKYFIVLIFFMSALITPPDLVTQVGIALPLIGLYFLTILIAKIFNWGKSDV